MKKQGRILQIDQDRKAILYNDQPLPSGKLLLHLVDDNHELAKDEFGKPRVKIMDSQEYKNAIENGTYKHIGFIN